MTREQYEHLSQAIPEAQRLQSRLALAGMATSPTYYKLTAIRQTLENRLRRNKKPHTQGCLCPNCDTWKPQLSPIKRPGFKISNL